MNFSKQYLNELSLKTNFIKDNIEKVLRLTDIPLHMVHHFNNSSLRVI